MSSGDILTKRDVADLPAGERAQTVFGANSGKTVQMSMRTDRLPQHDSLRPPITSSRMSPRQIAGSRLLHATPGSDSTEARNA